MQTQPQGTAEAFDVSIPTNGGHARGISLPGRLCLPAPPTGLVIFAHGSNASRHSPRNALVASAWRGRRAGGGRGGAAGVGYRLPRGSARPGRISEIAHASDVTRAQCEPRRHTG